MTTKRWSPDWMRRQWLTLWFGIRYPLRLKTAWINVLSWVFALIWVGLSITASLITRNFGWSFFFVMIVGAMDFVMLHRSLEGLLWIQGVQRLRRKKLRRAGGPQGD